MVSTGPEFRVPYFYLGDAYQDEGSFKESRKYYRLALRTDPFDSKIYNNLGVVDELDGHLKEAELNYRRFKNLSLCRDYL